MGVMCMALNAITAESYAVALLKKAATISSLETAAMSHGAQDALDSPDAQFLALLMQGKVVMRCPGVEVLYGLFPFAAWSALVARKYFVGATSPQLTEFLEWLGKTSMISASGAPNVQTIYLALQKFLENPGEVLLAQTDSIAVRCPVHLPASLAQPSLAWPSSRPAQPSRALAQPSP